MPIYSDFNMKVPKSQPLVEDFDSVIQSLFSLFATEKRERVFRPELGVILEDYLYDPVDKITAFAMLDEIIREITPQEPRIELDTGRSFVIPYEEELQFDVTLMVRIIALGDFYFPVGLTLKR